MQTGKALEDLLLERAEPLALLEGLFCRASASKQGGIVLVTGEAGIGKTALVESFLCATGSRARRFVGACEALSTPRPLGPIHDFCAELPPRLRQMLEDGVDRAALFTRILDELVRGPEASLLVLEDVHWADAATLDLLKFVGRRIRREPVLVLVTARDDASCWATLRPVLADLPSGQLARIELQPLSLDAVQQLAGAQARFAPAVHGATGGNPFFVVECLRSGGDADKVPRSVRDAVLARAGRLQAGERELLEQVSVFPRKLPLAVLRDLPVPLDALDGCVAAGLLLVEGGSVRFRHELARVALEEAIAPARARRLHSAALRVLAAGNPGFVESAQLAHHALGAWDAVAVAEWAPKAGQEAAARGALRESVAHFSSALESGQVEDGAQRAALLEALARSHFELNELQAAATAYREAIALCASHGLGDSQVRCLASLAMPLVRMLRNREADEAVRSALQLAANLPGARSVAGAYATEAYLRMLNRDYLEAIAAAEEAIAMAQEGDRATLARAHEALGAASIFLDYKRGCALLRKSMEIAQDLSDGGAAVADAYLMLSTASGELFELDAADALLEEGIAFARGRDLDRQAGYMEAWVAMCDLYRGRWSSAAQRSEAILSADRQPSTSRVMALVALGRLRTRRGDPGGEAVLDEALELAQRSGTLQRLAPVCLARAEAAWLRDDPAAMLKEVDRVEPLARAKSHPWFVGELAFWRWQAGGPVSACQGAAPPFRHQLQGRWHEAARDWHARGCPYEEARALAGGDEGAQRAGLAILDALGAQPLARRMRKAMHASGIKAVPRGPALATRGNPAGLTRRELEILHLLGQQLRPAQIAVRLSRSVRTVDHHVDRSMRSWTLPAAHRRWSGRACWGCCKTRYRDRQKWADIPMSAGHSPHRLSPTAALAGTPKEKLSCPDISLNAPSPTGSPSPRPPKGPRSA